MNVYRYLPQQPAALAVFQQTMSDLSADEGLAVRDAYDFAGCHMVVDVGGGRGGLLAILYRRSRPCRGFSLTCPSSWRVPRRSSKRSPCGGGVSWWGGIFWR